MKMENFNNKQKTVSHIIELFDSYYEFYCMDFSNHSLKLQGKYNSSVITTIKREFNAEAEVNRNGYVEFYFKFNNEAINIVLT